MWSPQVGYGEARVGPQVKKTWLSSRDESAHVAMGYAGLGWADLIGLLIAGFALLLSTEMLFRRWK